MRLDLLRHESSLAISFSSNEAVSSETSAGKSSPYMLTKSVRSPELSVSDSPRSANR